MQYAWKCKKTIKTERERLKKKKKWNKQTKTRSNYLWTVGQLPKKKKKCIVMYQFSSVQSLTHVRLFATPWTAARQASLSITNSQSSLKLIPIELVMPSNNLILCHPLLLLPSIVPSIRVFSVSQIFASGCQSIRVLASASVLSMNIQDWFPLGLTGWISLQSKALSRVFSNITVQTHQFFGTQLSL